MTSVSDPPEMTALEVEASEEFLGEIDRLVEEGSYLTRSEAVRAALACQP